MKSCWEINYKVRPSFSQLAPAILALLDDDHRKYYTFLADKFKRQFQDSNRIFRREPRDVNSVSSNGTQANPPNRDAQNPKTPSYITILPENIPEPAAANTGYLQPQFQHKKLPQQPQQNTGYLQPVNNRQKPEAPRPVTNGNSSYVTPVSSRKVEDSYGGSASQSYVADQKDTYINEDAEDDYDVNNPFLEKLSPVQTTDFDYIDDEKQPGGYLMPRLGSNISSSTVNSTAPLVKGGPSEFQPEKKSKFDMKFKKKSYAPSPPPIKSTKLTEFRPNLSETDV